MNQAIDQLLKKSVRRHPHQKNKPELHMEQGKHKESICKEAEMLPPRNVSRESDNEQTVELCWRQWIQTDVSKTS